MSSLRSINRKIDHLKYEEAGQDKQPDNKQESGADYLEAYRYMYNIRAFPNDTFDWRLLAKARAHAHAMPVAKLRPDTRKGMTAMQPWQFMGPTNLQIPPDMFCFGVGPTNGRINAVAYDPKTPTTIYAGAAEGGFWKSTNGGSTWNWLSSSWSSLAVNCIAIDSNNTNNIYVGLGDYQGKTGSSSGLMISNDGGGSWSTSMSGTMVASILIDPTNSANIIIGTGGSGAYGSIYQSKTSGKSFNQVFTLPDADMPRFPTLAATHPKNGVTRFFAVAAGRTKSLSNSRVLYSDDNGKTWSNMVSPVLDRGNFHWAYAVTTSPTDPNAVYVLDSENNGLYTSSDQGKNWVDVSSKLPSGSEYKANYNFSQNSYDYYIMCGNRLIGNTTTDVLYLGLIDVQASTDKGNSWTSVGGPTWLPPSQGGVTHNDQHCLALNPLNLNQVLIGNDGGVYQVTYNGQINKYQVISLNQNLGNTMFYKIACHPNDPNVVFGGSQDNATPVSRGDLFNWVNRTSGDGGGVGINKSNPQICFGTSENGLIHWTTDGWGSESDISPGFPDSERTSFVTPIEVVSGSKTVLYSGSNFLYTWDDNARSWRKSANDATYGTGAIGVIKVAPSDSTRVYTASGDGAITTSNDSGKTVRFVPGAIIGVPNILDVNPKNSTDIIAGYGGSGFDHLYRCTNTAIPGFAVWSDISGTGTSALPDASINGFTRDIDDPANTWYVGTDAGLFMTTNAGVNWANIGTPYGLPDVIVMDIQAVPGTRYLNVGTFGRGMWRMYLSPDNVNVSSFKLSANPVIGGNTLTGTITLNKAAPTGGELITLSGDATVQIPATINIPEGSSSAQFNITTNIVSTDTDVKINAAQYTLTDTVSLKVLAPKLSSVSALQNPVVGGSVMQGTVTLTGNAPMGGINVSLSSNVSNFGISSSVNIPAGQHHGVFAVTTPIETTDTPVTITASVGGVTLKTNVTVLAASLQSITLSSPSVVGGSQFVISGALTFNGPTPKNGVVVKISSNKTAAATVPSSMTVKLTGSSLVANFTVTHLVVKAVQSVTITATAGGKSYTAGLQVNPFAITSLTLTPLQLKGGSTASGVAILNASPNSKTGSVTVTLTSSLSSVSVPGSIKVTTDQTSVKFNATTQAVAKDAFATITASVGSSSQQVGITVLTPVLTKIVVNPTKVVGSSKTTVTGGVEINSPAPSGGLVIKLGSSDTTAVTVPDTVTIPSGKTTVTFTVGHKKVSKDETVTLGALLNNVNATTTLAVGK